MKSLLTVVVCIALFTQAYGWPWNGNLKYSNSKCKYKIDPIENLSEELDNRLINQNSTKEELYDIISDWYKDREWPLVIPFSGPTRTGKTLTARIIEDSFLMSDLPFGNDIKKISEELKNIIINGINECNKLNIFVFDEIQSVSAEVFQNLQEFFDPRGYITLDPIANERLYTRNSIFIFITDITEDFYKIITKNENQFQDKNDLKKKLTEKLAVNDKILAFTRHMKSPIIYYPFYSEDLKRVIVVDWKNEVMKQKHYSNITLSDDIINYLVLPTNRIIKYDNVTVDGKILYIATDSFGDAKNVINKIMRLSEKLINLIPKSDNNNNGIEFEKSLKFILKYKNKINTKIDVKYMIGPKPLSKSYLFESSIAYYIIQYNYIFDRDFLKGNVESFKLLNKQ